MVIKILSYVFAASILAGSLSQVEVSSEEALAQAPVAAKKAEINAAPKSGCNAEADRVLREMGY